MKILTTLVSIILTTISYSQMNDLVAYKFQAQTPVKQLTIVATESHDEENTALGRVDYIQDSTINLELNPNRNYTLIINGDSFVNITPGDIAEFRTEALKRLQVADQGIAVGSAE